MSSTDERVVRMKFENAQFKKAAAETRTTLKGVDDSLTRSGKNSGLLNMSKDMETVKLKASAMQVAVITAISNIANRAVNAGIDMAKSLTLDPAKAGFDEYELKMKSIQTILANTKGESLASVTAELNKLNEYADYTIYNFGDMTSAIGQLTTSGMKLSKATATVKGFHNVVALSGGSALEASQSMVQMSQGLQSGVLKARDWFSLSTRGLATQGLQKSLFETGKAMGTIKNIKPGTTFKEWSKSTGGFQASLESGWLESRVFTKTMKVMSGDIKSVGKLMKMGYSRKAAKDLLAMSEDALDSATKVRTLTAFWDTLKEQMGSGWSQIFEILIGDFDEATSLFTTLSETAGEKLGLIFGYTEKMLKGWDEMGGRAAIFQTVQNLVAPLAAIFKVVGNAWTKAFPPGKAGDGLTSMSKGLEAATSPLQLLAHAIGWLEAPLFAVFKLFGLLGGIFGTVKSAVTPLAKAIGDAIMSVDISSSGTIQFFKDLAAAVKASIDQFVELMNQGKNLKDSLSGVSFDMPDLGGMLSGSMSKINVKGPNLGSMFDGGEEKAKGFADGLDDVAGGFKSVYDQAEKVDVEPRGLRFNPEADISGGNVSHQGKWDGGDGLDKIGKGASEGAKKVETAGEKVEGLWGSIKGLFASIIGGLQNLNLEKIVGSLNLAAMTTLMLSFSKALNSFSNGMGSFGNITGILSGLTGSLETMSKAMARQALAKMILALAVAMGVLAVSLWLLAKIPANKLVTAIGALTAMGMIFRMTLEAMAKAVDAINGKSANMLALSVMMIAFAAALVILALAVKLLNGSDISALVGVAAGMGIMVKAMQTLSTIDEKGMIKAGIAMGIVAVAMIIFAGAIKLFSMLDLGEFAQGLLFVSLALGVLVKLLTGFTTSLAGAAAIFIVVTALTALVGVITLFSLLDWGTFAKGMGMVTISLLVFVGALAMMTAGLSGAAAIAIIVTSLYLLVGVIALFSTLDWGTFFKGLGMMAIAILTLGALLAVLGVLSPLILLASVALLVFAAALMVAGVGLTLIAKGLAALMLLGAGAGAALTAFAIAGAMAFTAFFQTLALQAPILKDAFLGILQALIDGLVEAVPMIIDGAKRLWNALVEEFGGGKNKNEANKKGQGFVGDLEKGVKKKQPSAVKTVMSFMGKMVDAVVKESKNIGKKGAEFVTGLIEGTRTKVGDLVDSATKLCVEFAESLGRNLTTISAAGIQLIADFLNSIADGIDEKSGEIGTALTNIGKSMLGVGKDLVKGLGEGIMAMAEKPKEWIQKVVEKLPWWAKKLLKIKSPSRVFMEIGEYLVEGLTKGIQNNAASSINAVASMVSGSIAIAEEYVSKFVQRLDQQAIAAAAKAEGLALAAERAAASAEKTKSTADDKAAAKLEQRANAAATKAEEAEEKAAREREKANREQEFRNSDLITQAQMRAEDAQTEIDWAKEAERKSAAALVEAVALEKQARVKGVSKKEREKLMAAADKARRRSTKYEKEANEHYNNSRLRASQAMELQERAGREAAIGFDKEFNAREKAAADAAAYDKMTNAQKIAHRQKQAADAEKRSKEQLEQAKKLAYTDLEGANELAQAALASADEARNYLRDVETLKGQKDSSSTSGGSSVDLALTNKTAAAVERNQRYLDNATAAMGRQGTVFNQYNYSPEALSTTDIYRQTNNQLAHAAA